MQKVNSVKNQKEVTPVCIDPSDLVVDGVYFNVYNELVQIKNIDKVKKEMVIFNISERYTMYVKFEKHNLIRQIR